MHVCTRLSGIIHVLYAAMNMFLDDETSDDEIPDVVTKIISLEEGQMAIALSISRLSVKHMTRYVTCDIRLQHWGGVFNYFRLRFLMYLL